MPTLNITTSVSKSNISDPKQVLKTLSATASKVIGKPEGYFVVIIRYDADLSFGGDPDTPAAYAEISSIGAIGGDKNKTIVAAVTADVEKLLSVPTDRFYVNFHDFKASDWGWKGTTFEAIFAGQ